MTDQEKIEAYEQVAAIVDDRIALEKHFRGKEYCDSRLIENLRSHAYGGIVKLMRGYALPDLPHN